MLSFLETEVEIILFSTSWSIFCGMENTDDFLVKTISSPEGASDRSEIFFFVLLLDQTNVWPYLMISAF